MAITQFHCPVCTGAFQVDDAFAGRPVNCPHCRNLVTLPAAPRPGPPAYPPQPPSGAVQLACPLCTRPFQVPTSLAGQMATCPSCRGTVTIPAQLGAGPGMPPGGPAPVPSFSPPSLPPGFPPSHLPPGPPMGPQPGPGPSLPPSFPPLPPSLPNPPAPAPAPPGFGAFPPNLPPTNMPSPAAWSPPPTMPPGGAFPGTSFPSPVPASPVPASPVPASPAPAAPRPLPLPLPPSADATSTSKRPVPAPSLPAGTTTVPTGPLTVPTKPPSPSKSETRPEERDLLPPGAVPTSSSPTVGAEAGPAAPRPVKPQGRDRGPGVDALLPPGAGGAAAPFAPVPGVDSLLPPGAGPAMPNAGAARLPAPATTPGVSLAPQPVADQKMIRGEDGTLVALREPVKVVGHGDDEFELRSLAPEEKAQRRLKRNIIMFMFCAFVMVVTLIVLMLAGPL